MWLWNVHDVSNKNFMMWSPLNIVLSPNMKRQKPHTQNRKEKTWPKIKTKEQVEWSNEKRETQHSKKKGENEIRNKIEWFEPYNGHMHIQGSSTAMCMVLTTYHYSPTDVINSDVASWSCQTLTNMSSLYIRRQLIMRKLGHDAGYLKKT
jgi:hypothetical protein